MIESEVGKNGKVSHRIWKTREIESWAFFSIMLQLFMGLVIGWFYRLFHGRRSKTAACVTVGVWGCPAVVEKRKWAETKLSHPAQIANVYGIRVVE